MKRMRYGAISPRSWLKSWKRSQTLRVLPPLIHYLLKAGSLNKPATSRPRTRAMSWTTPVSTSSLNCWSMWGEVPTDPKLQDSLDPGQQQDIEKEPLQEPLLVCLLTLFCLFVFVLGFLLSFGGGKFLGQRSDEGG